jgi:DNA-binding MarR family transcriptional regulator
MVDLRSQQSAAVTNLIEEAVALHLQARAMAERLHQRPELTDACRGVLRDLARGGPRTVPQLARRRDCSRQHVQQLVNRLVAEGMAELIDNPDHRRSHLVSLTAVGKETLEAMWRREAELIAGLPPVLDAGRLEAAADVLLQLRRLLEAASPPITEADHR